MTVNKPVNKRLQADIDRVEKAAGELLPEHMQHGAILYVVDGIRGGDFMNAVFGNDFVELAGRADTANQAALVNWAQFLYSAPCGCWGNGAAVEAWCSRGGLRGVYAQSEANSDLAKNDGV